MTENNSTSKQPPVHNLKPAVSAAVVGKIAQLNKQLNQHTDAGKEYTEEVAEVFAALRNEVQTISQMISDEVEDTENSFDALTQGVENLEGMPECVFEYLLWISAIPKQFPDFLDYSIAEPLFKNTLICEDSSATFGAIKDLLRFLAEVTLPDDPNDSFKLSIEASWGLHLFLMAMSKTIDFELTHRVNGGADTEGYYDPR